MCSIKSRAFYTDSGSGKMTTLSWTICMIEYARCRYSTELQYCCLCTWAKERNCQRNIWTVAIKCRLLLIVTRVGSLDTRSVRSFLAFRRLVLLSLWNLQHRKICDIWNSHSICSMNLGCAPSACQSAFKVSNSSISNFLAVQRSSKFTLRVFTHALPLTLARHSIQATLNLKLWP